MTFQKHLRSVSRAASQRLGMRKSWRVFHDRSLLGRCYRGFVMTVLEYCPAVWCSAADTHLKLLDRAVSGALFLTVGVFECDIARRRSVAVLSMLIRSGITRCTLLMVLYLYRMCQCELHSVLCSCITSAYSCASSLQYSRTFIPISVSLWNDHADPAFDDMGLAGIKGRA